MRCPTLKELPPPPPDRTGWPWTEESPQLPDTMPDGQPWPRVSVVTPSYNQGQFLEETLRSVLLQGYPDLEYFVMDGGSTDRSAEILKKYERWLTQWVSEKDCGQSHAINKGWKQSSGTLIAYLNSDDLYCPGAIKDAALSWYAAGFPAVVYSDALVINERSEFLTHSKSDPFDLERMWAVKNPIRQPTAFLGREEVASINWIDESLHYEMDYDLWFRLSRRYRLVYVPGKVWAAMRQHPSAKATHSQALRAEFAQVLTRQLVEAGYPEDSAYQREIWRGRRFQAVLYYAKGAERRNALSFLLPLLRTDPVFVLRQPVKLLLELTARLIVGGSWFRTRRYMRQRFSFVRKRIQRILH